MFHISFDEGLIRPIDLLKSLSDRLFLNLDKFPHTSENRDCVSCEFNLQKKNYIQSSEEKNISLRTEGDENGNCVKSKVMRANRTQMSD